jgi:DNA polymerase-3 subunit gamma/tau
VDRLRSLMLLAATGDASTLDFPDETIRELQEIVSRIELSQLVQWLKVFSNLDYQLKNSPYGQLPLELAVVELLAAPPAPAIPAAPAARPAVPSRARPAMPAARQAAAEAKRPEAAPILEPEPIVAAGPINLSAQRETPALGQDQPDGQRRATSQAPGRVDEPQPPESEGSAPQSATVIEVEDNAAFLLEEIEAVWPQFVEDVRAESRLIYAQLDGVKPINIEEHTLVLLASKGTWQRSMLEQEKTRRLLERVLSKLLKNPARIRITSDEQEEMPDVRKQIQHARSDPRVRKAMNIFEAEIVGLETPEVRSP